MDLIDFYNETCNRQMSIVFLEGVALELFGRVDVEKFSGEDLSALFHAAAGNTGLSWSIVETRKLRAWLGSQRAEENHEMPKLTENERREIKARIEKIRHEHVMAMRKKHYLVQKAGRAERKEQEARSFDALRKEYRDRVKKYKIGGW